MHRDMLLGVFRIDVARAARMPFYVQDHYRLSPPKISTVFLFFLKTKKYPPSDFFSVGVDGLYTHVRRGARQRSRVP